MKRSATTRARLLPLALLAFAPLTSACARTGGDPVVDEPADVVFIVQGVVPDAMMQALFRGRVVLDAAGCLRLDLPDPATVVWPKGFRLVEGSTGLRVVDGDGAVVGVVGGSFAFGGGEVPELAEWWGISAEDRQRAETRCPGRYWIVGEIVRD